ncbi:MAG: T9SS type A sorting domain-containing protein [Saprospiraceae bacterium]|nr:T9SS type A sorting domain-containing protein [Saprospiraceae bacterium]
MKKFGIWIFLNLLTITISYSQDCKDCNILYCDGYICDDGSSADGVMTSRKCSCGSDISGACAKVEINLIDHPLYDPSLPSALKFTTQESGNFAIYFSDQFCTINDCFVPEIQVNNNSSFEVPEGDIVYMTICKNGGNAGRRDLSFKYFPVQSSEAGYCDDNLDNDLDGYTDCEDNDCSSFCDAPDSGSGGGLESNGRLGSKLSLRNFQLVKKGSPLLSPAYDIPVNVRSIKSSRNEHSAGNFSDYIPVNALNGLKINESTPIGLNNLTNGKRIYAIDASNQEDRVGSILMISTNSKVYEHTKPTCDRLMGTTLEKVYKKNYGGDSLITYKLTRKGRVPEYAVSFSARQIVPGSVVVENHWTLDQFPDGAYTNIQIWTSTESMLEQWVTEILSNLRSFNDTFRINSSGIPETFIKKGWIENGRLSLEVQSNGHPRPITISGSYSKTEIQESEHPFNFDFQMDGVINTTKKLDIEDFCDLGLQISNGGETADQVYFADGQWGLDYNDLLTHISAHDVTPSEQSNNKGYQLRRNISLEATTEDYISVYRSLHPRFKSSDVSQYNSLKFASSGTGVLEVTIVKKSIKEWTHHFKTSVLLLEDETEFELPFHHFRSSMIEGPLNADDIVMVVFTIKSIDGNKTETKLSLKDLSFESSDLQKEKISPIKNNSLIAYPNPFSNTLEFQFESAFEEPFDLGITNLQGTSVLYIKGLGRIGINKVKINTDTFHEGMYFIHIKSLKGGNRIKKVYCNK